MMRKPWAASLNHQNHSPFCTKLLKRPLPCHPRRVGRASATRKSQLKARCGPLEAPLSTLCNSINPRQVSKLVCRGKEAVLYCLGRIDQLQNDVLYHPMYPGKSAPRAVDHPSPRTHANPCCPWSPWMSSGQVPPQKELCARSLIMQQNNKHIETPCPVRDVIGPVPVDLSRGRTRIAIAFFQHRCVSEDPQQHGIVADITMPEWDTRNRGFKGLQRA